MRTEDLQLAIEEFWPAFAPMAGDVVTLLLSMTSELPAERPTLTLAIERLKRFADSATSAVPAAADNDDDNGDSRGGGGNDSDGDGDDDDDKNVPYGPSSTVADSRADEFDFAQAAKLQCRGIARRTGIRCQITSDLNADEMCSYHKGVEPKFPRAGVDDLPHLSVSHGSLFISPHCDTVEQAQQAWALYLRHLVEVLPHFELAATTTPELQIHVRNLLWFQRYLERYRDAMALGRWWNQSDMLAQLRALKVELETIKIIADRSSSSGVNDQQQLTQSFVGNLRDVVYRTTSREWEVRFESLRFSEFGGIFWNNDKVAVKTIVEDEVHLNEGMKNAIRVQLLQLLDCRHPHVLDVYGACLTVRPLIVFQYVENDCMKFLQSSVPNRRFLWRIFEGAARGIARLHNGGFPLGRFTVEDIFVTGQGHARINPVNLGAVMALADTSSSSSHEVIHGAATESPAPTVLSNVYNLGVCLHQALSHCTGAKGNLKTEDVQLAIETFWPTLAPMAGDVVTLLLNMTSDQPAERPRMAFVIEMLKKFADSATNHIPMCADLRSTLESRPTNLHKMVMEYGNAAATNEEFQTTIDLGIVDFLVQVTRQGTDKEKYFAICALRNIANREEWAGLVADADLITILVTFAKSGSLKHKTAAVGAIMNLTLFAPASKPALKQAGVKEALECVLRHDSATTDDPLTKKLVSFANTALQEINTIHMPLVAREALGVYIHPASLPQSGHWKIWLLVKGQPHLLRRGDHRGSSNFPSHTKSCCTNVR